MDLGLDFESADKERYDWISVHVTPAMTETVDCLERLGLVTRQISSPTAAVSGGLWGGRLLHLAGGSAHGENAVVYTEDTTSAMVSPA